MLLLQEMQRPDLKSPDIDLTIRRLSPSSLQTTAFSWETERTQPETEDIQRIAKAWAFDLCSLTSPCSVITLVILPFPYPVKIALLPGGLYVIAVQGPRERAAEPEEDGDETRLKELEGGENVQIEPRPSVAVKEALEPRAKAVLEKPNLDFSLPSLLLLGNTKVLK